jgi:hypothetical protein
MNGIKWNSVLGYEGYYEISTIGEVRSLDRRVTDSKGRSYLVKGRHKKIFPDKDGYSLFRASKKGSQKLLKVHREVLKSFNLVEGHSKLQVNHKNGVKSDNRIENLEWCTARENNIHKSIWLDYGTYNTSKIISDKDVINLANDYLKGWEIIPLSEKYSVSVAKVRSIVRCTNHFRLLVRNGLPTKLLKESMERKKKKWVTENYEKFIDDYKNGATRYTLVEKYEISENKAKKIIKYIGDNFPDYKELKNKHTSKRISLSKKREKID